MRADLLGAVQRFRGAIYLKDGAIRENDLTPDGRHLVPIDENSWHVLTMLSDGRVCACLRFLDQQSARTLDHLQIRDAALGRSAIWSTRFRKAIEDEILYARCRRISFGEVGGWAIAEDRRMTMDPLRTILATYGLLELLGSCSGVATATQRHDSAPMLRRIGLSPLTAGGVELPPYYDPRYGCSMEVLRFDSRLPNPKFRPWVDELAEFLRTTIVVSSPETSVAAERVRWTLPVPTPVPAFA